MFSTILLCYCEIKKLYSSFGVIVTFFENFFMRIFSNSNGCNVC